MLYPVMQTASRRTAKPAMITFRCDIKYSFHVNGVATETDTVIIDINTVTVEINRVIADANI
jgi:hypothetical protein